MIEVGKIGLHSLYIFYNIEDIDAVKTAPQPRWSDDINYIIMNQEKLNEFHHNFNKFYEQGKYSERFKETLYGGKQALFEVKRFFNGYLIVVNDGRIATTMYDKLRKIFI